MESTIHSTVPFQMLETAGAADLLAGNGVGAEVYFNASVLDDLSPERALAAAESLRAAGVATTTFHAPFEEVWPGARDEEARRLSVRRIRQAIALAPMFRPEGIVVHGGYFDWLFDFAPDKWLEPARRSFSEIAEAAENAGVDIFLENVFDEGPEHLLQLREAVGSARLFYCFDPGHATLFSRLPLQKWAEAFGPLIREMHVHDNRGQRDDHLPVGEGSINFRGVILASSDAGARPILTVEPHRIEHFHRAVSALRAILASI